ncbi:MAG TPA: TetR/AcrR family transcriptional regulator [Flavitalea sp.]|nr:TetR/AcrR family transcriptional regulator [Flavitalea sp.]
MFIYICGMRVRDEAKEIAIRKKAMELIVQEGFDGLSMHKLAKAAGVSVATIYIYYKDREDLILNLCEKETMRMTEATLKDFDPYMSFGEGLKNQWRNRATFWLKNPIEAQFLERMRHSPYQERILFFLKTDFIEAMKTFVHNAIKNKELVKVPVEVFWSVAYAPLYQLVKFHMDGASFPGQAPFVLTDKVMNQTLSLVVKGLSP